MDITWGLDTELVSKNGDTVIVSQMENWYNVKMSNERYSIKYGKTIDLKYQECSFNNIPYSWFLVHN